MNRDTALKRLDQMDRSGRYVYSLRDLAVLFHEDSPRTLQAGINRLRNSGILEGVSRGLYVYGLSRHTNAHRIEAIAVKLRAGEYNYVSLESALSEWGVISQIPMGYLSVMTTGRKGLFKTPYGDIEFVHTSRPVKDILSRSVDVGRPLPLATLQAAMQDIRRVGRSLHMIDYDMLEEIEQEQIAEGDSREGAK